MKITEQDLKNMGVCSPGLTWFRAQKETDVRVLLSLAIKDGKQYFANWAMVRLLSEENKIRYEIFAAAAHAADAAASAAASVVIEETQNKILRYGLELLLKGAQ